MAGGCAAHAGTALELEQRERRLVRAGQAPCEHRLQLGARATPVTGPTRVAGTARRSPWRSPRPTGRPWSSADGKTPSAPEHDEDERGQEQAEQLGGDELPLQRS